jgi:hypothetical protein
MRSMLLTSVLLFTWLSALSASAASVSHVPGHRQHRRGGSPDILKRQSHGHSGAVTSQSVGAHCPGSPIFPRRINA